MGYPILISCFCFLFDWLYTHVKKRVEDVMPIATGHEREELAAELEGKKILEDVNNPVGPFGTKRMSRMVFGFGWRKASCMSVQFVHSILCWKL
ncbi:hypothetical protein V6Z11_A05G132700 [Gossypium hirsutum]|uniref:Cytochrome c oxidase subunit 5b-2, mitochondrial n=1 Tax=Gossypium hirsutum TaxID=3635 RepID=A0ABM3BQL0_GOSHI|nr:cytochrome c oxidase subunit 5b-2, mitochondrial-like [Gossypium hirsutum]